ncbi:MAG: xanthine dehydrogenase family protein subunit [Chloroflexi bacterium]|jgi:carbon-monoxide dehydrogenase medium subunit|nr:xanthine dehydrogenase family protein subunit [Chloroflexota bacterium]
MFPVEFEYEAPTTVEEAIRLLAESGGEAKILAGGHSLLPMLKLRLAQPPLVIDIGRIAGLSGVSEQDGGLRIGATTTETAIQDSELVQRLCPLLSETAAHIGDQQVRNRGTIGGTLAHGDPAADMTAAVLAAGGSVTVQGPNGERTIPADDLFLDMMTTALEPDEVLTSVWVQTEGPRTGSAYEKFANAASGYAIAGVASVITLAADGTVARARIAITGVGSKATRASGVEAALQGKRADDQTIAAAAEHAVEGVDLIGDLHADESYREHLAKVIARRSIQRAVGRAATKS